jgi:hypothetical protein
MAWGAKRGTGGVETTGSVGGHCGAVLAVDTLDEMPKLQRIDLLFLGDVQRGSFEDCIE